MLELLYSLQLLSEKPQAWTHGWSEGISGAFSRTQLHCVSEEAMAPNAYLLAIHLSLLHSLVLLHRPAVPLSLPHYTVACDGGGGDKGGAPSALSSLCPASPISVKVLLPTQYPVGQGPTSSEMVDCLF